MEQEQRLGMSQVQTAVIFAAGVGSRLQPLTSGVPKPLVRVGRLTLIDIVINQLLLAGIKHIIVNVCYKAEMILDHLSGRRDCKITILHEESRLETGGTLRRVAQCHELGAAVTCNVDTIWQDGQALQIKKLLNYWQYERTAAQRVVMLVCHKSRFVGGNGKSDFQRMGTGRLQFTEQPKYYYSGTQVIDVSLVLQYQEKVFSLGKVYREMADQKGVMQGVHSIEFDGACMFHVGDVAALQEARVYQRQYGIEDW